MGGERDDAKAFLGRCVTEANEVAARMGARLVVDEEKRAMVEAGLRVAPRVGAAIACAASNKSGEPK